MPTNKQSTAVKKAWSQANKLHKAIQLEGWDDQGVQSTPGTSSPVQLTNQKGPGATASSRSKTQTLAYSKWLAEMALDFCDIENGFQSPASSEQPQISSEETNPAIVEDKPFALKSISTTRKPKPNMQTIQSNPQRTHNTH